MGVQKIQIDEFISLSKEYPVFDVRSPLEYLHAHIPSAYSLPLFTDDERRTVGTAYKQQSRQKAIKIGLDFFGLKMRKIVEDVEAFIADRCSLSGKAFMATNEQLTTNIVLIHCWRGGMRSAAVAWLLDLYGYKTYTLTGGYKTFRNWVLKQFDKPYNFKVLGGYTGSGKTVMLEELQRSGQPVINLEALANHKGSAFGSIGEKPQPSQEMFENLLACQLHANASGEGSQESLWIEDESQRIGKLYIPQSIWEIMRNSSVHFLDIPFEERLNYLVTTYGTLDKNEIETAIIRIQKRLGGLETKNAINFLVENDLFA